MPAGVEAAPLAASYFDGRTSRRYRVRLHVSEAAVVVEGDIERTCALEQLQLSERSVRAARTIRFPDGAYAEIDDAAAFDHVMARHGRRDSLVVRLQHSWRGALAAVVATTAVVVLGYLFLLPPLAKLLARALPVQVERKLGDGMLELLDRQVFAPSTLPPSRQHQLAAAFSSLMPPAPQAVSYRIVFRHSRIGPNAFALPSGDIVLTDEMVTLLADDDQAVMGVLAHELGHLHERHLTRRIIQGSAIAATTTLLFGDVSSMLATLPALALDLKYSRDAEREADDYAVAMLKANGIAPEHLAQVFVKLERLKHGDNAYLSSHPASAERIARIRGQ